MGGLCWFSQHAGRCETLPTGLSHDQHHITEQQPHQNSKQTSLIEAGSLSPKELVFGFRQTGDNMTPGRTVSIPRVQELQKLLCSCSVHPLDHKSHYSMSDLNQNTVSGFCSIPSWGLPPCVWKKNTGDPQLGGRAVAAQIQDRQGTVTGTGAKSQIWVPEPLSTAH